MNDDPAVLVGKSVFDFQFLHHAAVGDGFIVILEREDEDRESVKGEEVGLQCGNRILAYTCCPTCFSAEVETRSDHSRFLAQQIGGALKGGSSYPTGACEIASLKGTQPSYYHRSRFQLAI